MPCDNSADTLQESIYKCRLVAHDYLFFSTMGFRDTRMTNYIGNYALMYAINRRTSDIQRNASGTSPFYEKDMPKMKIYATPASIASESKVPIAKNNLIRWENQPQVYVTFNSINTITQLTETIVGSISHRLEEKLNFRRLTVLNFMRLGETLQVC